MTGLFYRAEVDVYHCFYLEWIKKNQCCLVILKRWKKPLQERKSGFKFIFSQENVDGKKRCKVYDVMFNEK